MKHKILLVVLVAHTLAACLDAPSTAVTSQDVITGDAFRPPLFLAARNDARRLGHGKLADERAAALMTTSEGQLMLSFLVSCALPFGATFTAHGIGGIEIDFFGDIGLAKHWSKRALNLVEQREVSACLFARLNAEGVIVPVSIRGVHLATSSGEAGAWTMQEGAFWGNVFTEHLEWFACRGTAPADPGILQDRQCAKEDPAASGTTICGLTYAGMCTDVCTENGRGVYRSCDGNHQAITTFLLDE